MHQEVVGFTRSFGKFKERLPPGLNGEFEMVVVFLGAVEERLRGEPRPAFDGVVYKELQRCCWRRWVGVTICL